MTGGLSGYVCDAHTGQPIEGVAVEYDTYITWTNVDGWYEMDGIPEGIFYFFYSKEGYETTYWSIQISSEVWNNVPPVELTPVAGNGGNGGNGQGVPMWVIAVVAVAALSVGVVVSRRK